MTDYEPRRALERYARLAEMLGQGEAEMRIPIGRSEWLESIEHVWMEIDAVYSAPFLHTKNGDVTLMQLRLYLRCPFNVGTEIHVARNESDRINAQVPKNAECLPEYLRKVLSDDMFSEVFLMGYKSDTVSSIVIHVEAIRKIRDFNRFRDFIVKKLTQQ